GPTNFGGLWGTTNPQIIPDPLNLNQRNLGDPIVVYDHLADRWLLAQFLRNPAQTVFGMGIAISQTPDPVGGVDGVANTGDEWFLYTFTNAGDFPVFPDYEKFGVWQDAYYMTSYEGNTLGLFAFDRIKMLNGDPTSSVVRTTIANTNPSGNYRDGRILPADLDGPAPPPGTPGIFLRTVDDNQDTADANDRIEIYSAVPNFAADTLTVTLVEDIRAAQGLQPFDTM